MSCIPAYPEPPQELQLLTSTGQDASENMTEAANTTNGYEGEDSDICVHVRMRSIKRQYMGEVYSYIIH